MVLNKEEKILTFIENIKANILHALSIKYLKLCFGSFSSRLLIIKCTLRYKAVTVDIIPKMILPFGVNILLHSLISVIQF